MDMDRRVCYSIISYYAYIKENIEDSLIKIMRCSLISFAASLQRDFFAFALSFARKSDGIKDEGDTGKVAPPCVRTRYPFSCK